MNNVIKWNEQSIVAEGYLRSAIYDLNRYNLHLVDKNINQLIKKVEGKDLQTIREKLDEAELEWFDYLDQLEMFLYVPENNFEHFKAMNRGWDSPNHIVSASIHENNDIERSLALLKLLNCYHATLIIENTENLEKILSKHFEYTHLSSLDVLIAGKKKESDYYDKLAEKFTVIHKFISNEKTIGAIETERFNIPVFHLSINCFFESQRHNLHFNRKLHIDPDGNISNIPGITGELNIKNTDLLQLKDEIISNRKIKQYWEVSKDNTDICNICEFRYQCIDKRIPKKRRDDEMFYYEEECGYNPFIGKWFNEDNFLSLEQTGIQSNSKGFYKHEDKIKELNEQLW